jgi:hypothetical protein
MLLAYMLDLSFKGFDLPYISAETAVLSCNSALGVLLQLEHVLGVSRHVRPTVMVVVLKDIVRLINARLPLWIRVVLNWVQRDGCARGVWRAMRAQGGECYMSSLLHGVIQVVPDNRRGPRAPIKKHGVGPDVNVDLIVG